MFISLFAGIVLSASTASAQDITCAGGFSTLPDGAYFYGQPSGCGGQGTFMGFMNETIYCLFPLINDFDMSMISVTGLSAGGMVGTGVETTPGLPDPGEIDCIAAGQTVFGFVPDTDRVRIGFVGYTTSANLPWQMALIDVKPGGARFHVMNPIDPMTGMPKPSRPARYWDQISYNVRDPASIGSFDSTTGLPVLRINGSMQSHY